AVLGVKELQGGSTRGRGPVLRGESRDGGVSVRGKGAAIVATVVEVADLIPRLDGRRSGRGPIGPADGDLRTVAIGSETRHQIRAARGSPVLADIENGSRRR